MSSLYYKCLVVFIAYFTVCKGQSDTVNQDVVYQKVERNIDVVNQLVKIKSKVTVENKGHSVVKYVLYSVEPNVAANVGWISATVSCRCI